MVYLVAEYNGDFKYSKLIYGDSESEAYDQALEDISDRVLNFTIHEYEISEFEDNQYEVNIFGSFDVKFSGCVQSEDVIINKAISDLNKIFCEFDISGKIIKEI